MKRDDYIKLVEGAVMYVLFGAGEYGKRALQLVGRDNVRYFVDNDASKKDNISQIPVYVYAEKESELREIKEKIIISVSYKYENEIALQLESRGIFNYVRYSDYTTNLIRDKIAARMDYLQVYKKTIQWIKNNTVKGKGIISADMEKAYPEVSGYFISTLLYWGERELALSYATWLCSIQKDDGAWWDVNDEIPYVFDTAQILKGLISVREIMPKVDECIQRGCEWLMTLIQPSGRLLAAREDIWSGVENTMSELIHIYCLSPLQEAGYIFGNKDYIRCAELSLDYYLENYMDRIMDFHLLSHFYAYVIEGLIDMGQIDIAQKAMDRIEKYQKSDGSVPGYKDVNWVCSTGLFQFALIWYRLGNIKCGNLAFEYACKLQNESGGWFGSYLHSDYPNEEPNYLPSVEISWASKYFLDALRYKAVASFEAWNPGTYFENISEDDPKYKVISNVVKKINSDDEIRILEVGSYHGRYLRNLLKNFPCNRYYAVDISSKVLSSMDDIDVEKKVGALTYIPYSSGYFDIVYACESLEHAVDIESAIREVARVLKSGGFMIYIDNNINKLGIYELEDWEQWFDENKVKQIMNKYCSSVEIIHNVEALDNEKKDLFSAWIGVKK